MKSFLMSIEAQESANVLKVGFNPEMPASNEVIIKDAIETLNSIKNSLMGKPVKISGPASLPVAIAIGHILNHICPMVACFDPKLNKFVVAVSHDARWAVGDLID